MSFDHEGFRKMFGGALRVKSKKRKKPHAKKKKHHAKKKKHHPKKKHAKKRAK
jgi:hypothetical protein